MKLFAVTLFVLMLFAQILARAVAAQPSPAPAVPLPGAYHLVYEHIAGGAHPDAASKLEVTFEKGAAKLRLDLTEQGKPRRIDADPWAVDAAGALWREIARADVFTFKPQTGAGAPDFGEVRLSVEATEQGKTSATSHAWNAPLRNDGQVWALLNHLDGLMNPRAHEAGAPAAAPGPVEPPGGTPTAPPGPPASPFPSEQPIFTPAPPAAPQ